MSHPERRRARNIGEYLSIAAPLALVWALGMFLLAVVSTQGDERTAEMLLDPTFNPNMRWYTGLVSNLGILAWTTAVVAAVAGAWICRLGARPTAARFLMWGGGVAAALLLDDLFQIHSIVLPSNAWLPKPLTQLMLIGVVALWASSFSREIRRTHAHLLAAALGALALSFVVDSVFRPVPGDAWLLIEDGAKFLGILAWATYFVITSRDICKSVFTDALLVDPASFEDLLEARPVRAGG